MKILIEWCEKKTASSGKEYIVATVVENGGRKLENVAIFSFFPDYHNIRPGVTVEGIIQEKDYKGKPSYSLVEGNLGANKFTSKKPDFAKAQETKHEYIKEAQTNKNDAIMTSASMRDAVQLAIAEMETVQSKIGFNLAESVETWRKWIVSHWEL